MDRIILKGYDSCWPYMNNVKQEDSA